MTRARSTAHLYVIQGLGRPERRRRVAYRWYPLYMYRDAGQARRVFRYLIDMEVLPRELSSLDVQDFRIVPPNPAATFEVGRKRAAKARREGRSIAPSTHAYPATMRPVKSDSRLPQTLRYGHRVNNRVSHFRKVGT